MDDNSLNTCRLDAVNVKYVPESFFNDGLISRKEMEGISKDKPWLYEIVKNSAGNLAYIIIPMTWKEFKSDKARLLDFMREIIELSLNRGAKVVGLTGHLQNEEYIALFNKEISRANEIEFTTGLDSVLAWQSFSLGQFFERFSNDTEKETLFLFGVNQGYAIILSLFFENFSHPKEIKLIHDDIDELFTLKEFIQSNTKYRGKITLVPKKECMSEYYDCADFIVANGVNAIDIDKVKSGSKIISLGKVFPYDEQAAIQRIKQKQDILTLSGVAMMTNDLKNDAVFDLTEGVNKYYDAIEKRTYQLNTPSRVEQKININGCQLSPLLCASFEDCHPTIFAPSISNAKNYLRRMFEMEYVIGDSFNCRDYLLTDDEVEGFLSKYHMEGNK